jgi:2-dehydro-3-deoxyphosphogluconate aldolase/(4S)-4-hydroxy-2-oxoglutarate aldolase
MKPTDASVERTQTIRAIEAHGIVAIIRLPDAARVRAVVNALIEGGIKALEVTMSVPGAVALIREIAPTLPAGFLLGAGTVVDAGTARAVVDAGARFVVSPVFRVDVVAACHERGVPALPGCFSPTEILDAHDAGADIIKVFPATTVGPQYIRDLRAPLPQLKLMPTGGVTPANAGDWIRAGAAAIGIGSALVDAGAIARGEWRAVSERARQTVASVDAARTRP